MERRPSEQPPHPACPSRSPRRTSFRFRRLARRLIVLPAALCLAGAISGLVPGAGAATPARVQATQELAVLLSAHTAHRAPSTGAPSVALVPANTPITGEQTTLPVLARSIGAGGALWLQVMLPGRPAGLTGWIAQQGTSALVTPWRIIVDLAARRVRAYENGHLVKSFEAVVGKPSTPTPAGEFFVQEVLEMTPGDPGGPYALALSARSNVFQEFEGGPGQIAIHGRDNLGGTLGKAESHGCIRVATASIDWLAARIGAGTPVTIDRG